MEQEGNQAGPTAASPRTAVGGTGGRFLPGAILGGRYRIIALAGRGGMGEVYRADDLKLGQPVALKFLPLEFEREPDRLHRLLGEVRVAREVSHPNVCRVYDVGEVDGHHFITMEYVDGEDLAVLLRRIGRLPQEKALDLARQICAGLAAAHTQGIVHRDLKPANVMLDGRGRARITDFGLAGAAESMRGAESLSGTPEYMAPEQLERGEATPRADVYALGLLLYEMFVGKRPSVPAARPGSAPPVEASTPRPSSLVPGLDPAVDAAILKSLEREPVKRPASAGALLALLPGSDPLAAAVSAGETPSPEMVAAAGEEGTLPLGRAWGLLGLAVPLIAAAIYLCARGGGLDQVPMGRTPDSLRDRAREIAAAMGTEIPRPHDAWWIRLDGGYAEWYRARAHAPYLADAEPPALRFYYRQSPVEIAPLGSAAVTSHDPAIRWTGETYVATDMKGRLLEFRRMTVQVQRPDSAHTAPASVDWGPLLGLTGVDASTLRPSAPLWVPDVPCDSRVAWTATYGSTPIRIEAGAWEGRPVWLRTISPWERADRDPGLRPADPMGWILWVTVVVAVFFAFIVVARHNVRLGRSDRKGALRVAAAVFVCFELAFLLQYRWALDPDTIWRFLMRPPAFVTVSAWLYYLGIEPFLRRRWPHRLIASTRVLEGRVADPLVGREVLIGTLAGATCVLLNAVSVIVNPRSAPDLLLFWLPFGRAVDFWGSVSEAFGSGLINALGAFSVLLLARLVFRRDAVAWIAVGALSVFLSISSGPSSPVDWAASVLVSAIFILSMRVGLLCAVAAWSAYFLLAYGGPLTVDFTRWYGWRTLVIAGLLLGMAIWGFRAAIGRRRILSSSLLEA